MKAENILCPCEQRVPGKQMIALTTESGDARILIERQDIKDMFEETTEFFLQDGVGHLEQCKYCPMCGLELAVLASATAAA